MVVQVNVIVPTGQEKLIDLCDNKEQLMKMTVQDLKEKIVQEFKLSTDYDFRMIHKSEPLEESSLLSSYGIQHMSVIHCILKAHGGGEPISGTGDGQMGDKRGRNLSMERLSDFNTPSECNLM